MQIKVQSIHFNADAKLVEFIESKVNKLDQYCDNIVWGEVFLRVTNSGDMQNKVMEIKLNMPGKDLFVKKQSKSFEKAADQAVQALKRQVRKYKTKKNSKQLEQFI